jgi:hypothetical protein
LTGRVASYASSGNTTTASTTGEVLVDTETLSLVAASKVTIFGTADLAESSDAACAGDNNLFDEIDVTVDGTYDEASGDNPGSGQSAAYVFRVAALQYSGSVAADPSEHVINNGDGHAVLASGDHTVRIYLITSRCGGGTGTASVSNTKIDVDAEAL